MEDVYPKNFVILGAGSAGLLSALICKKTFPQASVTIVRSKNIPVIGVGESTTVAIPKFLHRDLEVPHLDFVRNVRPVWKLGNRFTFGDAKVPFFDYTFDSAMHIHHGSLERLILYYLQDIEMNRYSPASILMESNHSPFLRYPNGKPFIFESYGYHIDNQNFLDYLENISKQRNVQFITENIHAVDQDKFGNLTALISEEGVRIEGDFFLDCSGFRAELIDKVYEAPFQSYSNSLFFDKACIGSWNRTTPIQPFTTSATMNNGWCWNIEFLEKITRGYVFNSAYCSDEEARRELIEKCPEINPNTKIISFPSGRRESFWVNNLAAIGNASGFVEPIEATALHMVTLQLQWVMQGLKDRGLMISQGLKNSLNLRFRDAWDDIRDFIALHYKFNYHSNSPFWKMCREETPLGEAEEFVKLFQEGGATEILMQSLNRDSIFGFDGYLTILLGQRVPSLHKTPLLKKEYSDWEKYSEMLELFNSFAITTEDAYQMIDNPQFEWPVPIILDPINKTQENRR